MSGHFSRKIYDYCYTDEFIAQQVNPCKYRTLSGFGENNTKCQSYNGPRANQARSTGELGDFGETSSGFAYRADIESQLMNLDVPDSRCITLQTVQEKDARLAKLAKSKKIDYSSCNKKQDFTYTRLDIPVSNLRSVYINRYEFPIIDPKEFVYYGSAGTKQTGNQRWGVDTQLEAKDDVMPPNFKPSSKLTK